MTEVIKQDVNFRTAQEALRFYEAVKFDIKSEGFRVIDKQLTDPIARCVFCTKTIAEYEIKGVKVNDNIAKTQVLASICEEHAGFLGKLTEHSIELAEVQQMIRFFLPDSCEDIIKTQFMKSELENFPPIYLEYFALVKWSIEEKMLMRITDARQPQLSTGHTTVEGKVTDHGEECLLCGFFSSDDQTGDIDIFSPVKNCWMTINTCQRCTKDMELEFRDMEYEIRTIYFKDFAYIDTITKRRALQELSEAVNRNAEKVIITSKRMDVKRVSILLEICGVDGEHSIVKKPQEIRNDNAGQSMEATSSTAE